MTARTSGRAVLRIAMRETRSLIESPGGCLVIGTFWFLAGLLLVTLLFRFRAAAAEMAQSGQLQEAAVGPHINDYVIRPLFFNLGSVLIFFIPLLTMRSFAEERRTGALELLLSQPLRGADLLLGKFLGALFSLGVCLSILVLHALVLAIVSQPDWAAALAGFIGLLLLGTLCTAVGILLSVLSRSQVEAAVLSLGVLLALVIGPDAIRPPSGALSSFAGFISVMGRYEDFTRGVIDLGHVAFYGTLIFLVLAAALRSLDLVRWQG